MIDYIIFDFNDNRKVDKYSEILKLSKIILNKNEELERKLLVERTISECMRKLRGKCK